MMAWLFNIMYDNATTCDYSITNSTAWYSDMSVWDGHFNRFFNILNTLI